MLNRDKKQLLALAFPCLRRPGEKRPFFSDDIPTRQEFEALRKGLETGSVDDELLKKFFPRAYGGVRSLGIIPFYHEHNNPHQLAHRLEYPGLDEKELWHLVEWCQMREGVVTKVRKKSYEMEISGEKFDIKREVYPGVAAVKNAKEGDRLVVHRGCACLKAA